MTDVFNVRILGRETGNELSPGEFTLLEALLDPGPGIRRRPLEHREDGSRKTTCVSPYLD